MKDRPRAPRPEPHSPRIAARLNWLRAGVLGANDGIVSTAGLVVGVAGATSSRTAILLAGVAGLVAGALSMAAGEYVSVSTQRDTERALIDQERLELLEDPEEELEELAGLYREQGLPPELARQVAEHLTARDPLRAHLRAELGIDADELTSPWTAALSSAASFTVGAALPLLVMVLLPPSIRVGATFAAVIVALALTGVVSSRLGSSPMTRAILRNVVGGALAMVMTNLVGRAVGAGIT